MALSDEELQQLREENEGLREDISAAQTDLAESESDRSREYEASQLLIENTRLKAQLAATEAQAAHASSDEATATIAASAVDQLAAAKAALENPAGIPVDTTKGEPVNTTVYVEGSDLPEGVKPEDVTFVPAAGEVVTEEPKAPVAIPTTTSNGGKPEEPKNVSTPAGNVAIPTSTNGGNS